MIKKTNRFKLFKALINIIRLRANCIAMQTQPTEQNTPLPFCSLGNNQFLLNNNSICIAMVEDLCTFNKSVHSVHRRYTNIISGQLAYVYVFHYTQYTYKHIFFFSFSSHICSLSRLSFDSIVFK